MGELLPLKVGEQADGVTDALVSECAESDELVERVEARAFPLSRGLLLDIIRDPHAVPPQCW